MKINYKCELCGKTIEVFDENIPSCCGKPMKKVPLDICTQPAHAEHARPMDDENACDDGRAG
ncbi:MAG: hypothetical protein AYK22_00740 [Thermoplasmatales archaeon SG8-52-3]|jgi:hypothetical protein|nr:MAG: hypothetical protein AYK22_00740 [Thermoplasmatales archaeon SG8-52-3]